MFEKSGKNYLVFLVKLSISSSSIMKLPRKWYLFMSENDELGPNFSISGLNNSNKNIFIFQSININLNEKNRTLPIMIHCILFNFINAYIYNNIKWSVILFFLQIMIYFQQKYVICRWFIINLTLKF